MNAQQHEFSKQPTNVYIYICVLRSRLFTAYFMVLFVASRKYIAGSEDEK